MDKDQLDLESSQNYETEFSLMMDKMNCGKEEMDKLLEETYQKYPFVDNKKQLIYMLVREQRLEFVYGNTKEPKLQELNENLEPNLADFLDR